MHNADQNVQVCLKLYAATSLSVCSCSCQRVLETCFYAIKQDNESGIMIA